MKNNFVSLIQDPPVGFKNIPLTKHVLLGSRVAIYADSTEDATSLLDNFTERVQGIIITRNEQLSFTPLGPALWHIGVPTPMLPELASIAANYLDMLSFGQLALNQNEQLKLELVHSKSTQSHLAENYSVNAQRLKKKVEQLREEMTKSKRAEKRIVRLNNLREELLGLDSFNKKLTHITEAVVDTFDADFCRIWIIKAGDHCDDSCPHAKVTDGPHTCHHQERCLHLVASSGRYSVLDSSLHSRVPFGCYKIGLIASGDIEDFYTNDVTHDPRVHDHDWARQLGLVSFAGYRLFSDKGAPVGVIALFSKHAISSQEVGLLEGVANTTSQIIQKNAAAAEKEAMQANLLRAQKMEAIGFMAGGVAHDLNNILSGIVSYPELLLMQLPKDSELREPIKAIQESGKRAATVVADLLTVARGAATIRTPHDIHVLINEYVHSPECKKLHSIYPEIVCTKNQEAEHSIISCSPVHIKKIVMNLVNNGMEAITGKGTILISTRNQWLATQEASHLNIEVGDYLILSVKDDGTGIVEKDLESIFEPFYTRKVMGRSGTGLGLAIVWNSMQDHNGRVTVESSRQGTCFNLYFPIIKEAVEEEESVITEKFTNTEKHLLVVDDEPQLRDIACKMLESIGYTVDSVCSGELAVTFVKNNPVDLVVLDMLMEPGINGYHTYKEILKIYPDQKAVVVSGFSESDDVKATLSLGAGGFIKKPFSVAQLGRVVKAALDG